MPHADVSSRSLVHFASALGLVACFFCVCINVFMTQVPGGLQGASSNDRGYLLDQTRTYQAPPPEDRASFLRER